MNNLHQNHQYCIYFSHIHKKVCPCFEAWGHASTLGGICKRSASTSLCAIVHYHLINYATYMQSRHPHVHPGTAAVNQTAGSLAIKGRPFATDNHSISKSHQMNIKNQHQEENRNPDYCHRDFLSGCFYHQQ